MVVEEGQPSLPGVAAPPHAAEIACYCCSEISNPSLSSSPWILGAPQPGFSCARRRIRSRTSLVILVGQNGGGISTASTTGSLSDASPPRYRVGQSPTLVSSLARTGGGWSRTAGRKSSRLAEVVS